MEVGKRNGYKNFWWAIHNLIAHPLSEIFYWFRLHKMADWIHNETVPKHDPSLGGRG